MGAASCRRRRALRGACGLPGVIGVSPYMELTALAVHVPDMVPVLLRGIDPALERRVTDFRPLLVEGELASLQPGSNAVVIGRDIADQLGVKVGDPITLLVPMQGSQRHARTAAAAVHGRRGFQAGLEERQLADSGALADVRAFAPWRRAPSGLRLRFTSRSRRRSTCRRCAPRRPPGYRVQ